MLQCLQGPACCLTEGARECGVCSEGTALTEHDRGHPACQGLDKLCDDLPACRQQNHLPLVIGRQVAICAIWQHLEQEAGRRQRMIGEHCHQRHLHQHQLQSWQHEDVSTTKASSDKFKGSLEMCRPRCPGPNFQASWAVSTAPKQLLITPARAPPPHQRASLDCKISRPSDTAPNDTHAQ